MTGVGHRIARNATSMWGAEVLGRCFSYLALVYLARVLDLDANGQYSLAVNLVGLVASFGDLGLNALTIREVAADPGQASRYLRAVIVWRLLSSLLFLGGLAAWATLAGYEPLLRLAVLAMGTRLIFDGLRGGPVYLLQAHQEMGLQSGIEAMGSLLRLLGLVAVVGAGYGVVAACWVWSAVSALSLGVLAFLAARRGWTPDWTRFDLKDAARILRAALPLAVMGSLQTLYYRVDVVMLKSLVGNTPVALYANSYKLLEAALMLANMAALATLPALAACREDRVAFGRLVERVLRVGLLAGVLVSAVGGWVAPSLVTLLFGGRYAEAGPSASVLFLSAAPFFLNAVMVAVLTIRDPRRLVLWYLSLLVANVGLNLWLIPVLGPVGAAWATFFCELGGASVATVWTLSETPVGAGRRFARTLLAALVGAALMSFGASRWPGLHWLALGPLSYGLSLWALRAISWSECREFLRGVRRG